MLVSRADCEFVFQWDTNVVCYDETPATPTDFCGYRDPQTLTVYNFTVLKKSSPYEVRDDCRPISETTRHISDGIMRTLNC